MAATQHTSQTWVHPDLHEDRHDFSLVLGGPLFQLLRKAHLEGDHLELLRQRMLVITGGAWLPLLLLSVLSTSDGNVGRLSFFHDVEVHVRFLIALPVLIGAELIVQTVPVRNLSVTANYTYLNNENLVRRPRHSGTV